MRKGKVLVIATSRKTRGGITSVIKAHEQGEQWKAYQCKWIETHIDKGVVLKLTYLIVSLIRFTCLVPFYQVVHIHVASYSSLRRKMLFFRIAKLCHKKIITHFHPPTPDVLFAEKSRVLYQRMFSDSTKVIVLSNQWKEWLKAATGISANVQVIYNPCPQIKPFTREANRKYILFAGSIIERKGYTDLINAFVKIAGKHTDWAVVFAGNGEIDKGIDLARHLGIASQIEFKGWISGEEKERLFKNASIFCLPSYGEGFPMAVLDAWAYGLPVICTPVGGLPDVLKNEENALIFECGDIDALSVQLERLIMDDTLRDHIAKQSEKLSLTIFNLASINKQIGDLYKNVMDK